MAIPIEKCFIDKPVMDFLVPPTSTEIASHFSNALHKSRRDDTPYQHWLLTDVLPERLVVGILTLPIAPPKTPDPNGVRDTDNSIRTFFTPTLQSCFPACALFAEALQRSDVARFLGKTLGIETAGSYLRMEYIQDTDGAWLEPHCDIPEKLFSMVIYLCTGPEAGNWGTDIYDAQRQWVGRSSAKLNTAVIFVPGSNTWHGFDLRPINGVRRLLEINYVRPTWRDRSQLSFPDSPITLG